MSRFKLSIVYAVAPKTDFDVVVRGELSRVLELAVRLGYEGVEYNISDPFEADVKGLRRALDEAGLEASALSTGLSYLRYGYSLSSPNPSNRGKALEFFRRYVDVSVELGCRKVVVGLARGRCGVPNEPSCEEALRCLRSSLEELNDYAGERGAIIVFEPLNRYETKLVNKVSEAKELIKGLRNVKLLLDTFHTTLEERSPYDAILEAGNLIGHVHVADTNRLAPGLGMLDWERVLYRLIRVGYEGFLSIEALAKPSYEEMLKVAARTLKPLISF